MHWTIPVVLDRRFPPWATRLGRLSVGIARKFADGQLNLEASSLAYTTLLALVPLLAVSFSVLKAFGAHNALQPLLLEMVEPLGAQGRDVVGRVLGFVDNMQVGVLGSLGVATLFYTVISLLFRIEQSFNAMWRVVEPRGPARRFSDYLSIVLIGPVLVFAALGLAGAAMNSAAVRWLLAVDPLGILLLSLDLILPHLLTAGAFALLYGLIPNTRVSPMAALIGGAFAAVLWFASGRLFTSFVVSSAHYSAVYSGFAGAILAILWLYVNWLIILVGGQVAAYWQHPNWVETHAAPGRYNRRREALALELMTWIGHAHHAGRPPPTRSALQAHYPEPDHALIEDLITALQNHRLLMANNEQPPAYLPARAIEAIPLRDVLDATRGFDTPTRLSAVAGIMGCIDSAIAQTLETRTVKDLVLAVIKNEEV